jgi:hypothetical protein
MTSVICPTATTSTCTPTTSSCPRISDSGIVATGKRHKGRRWLWKCYEQSRGILEPRDSLEAGRKVISWCCSVEGSIGRFLVVQRVI